MTRNRLVEDLFVALRFFSRLPVPARAGEEMPFGAPPLSRIAYVIPIAGAAISLFGAALLLIATALGFPPFLAASLAVATLVLATGAFHEDGLADTADGFGGGRDKARRLEIMRDSRIGTYGACAIALSLLIRVAALEALLVLGGPIRAVLALAAAGAASRAAGIVLLQVLPAARSDGASAASGQPGADPAMACALMAALVVAVLLVPSFGVGATFAGLIAPALAVLIVGRLSARLIGGQTGDVAGATQQVAEIAFLLAVLMFARAV
ncbi:adenosylcobinamide-GDP ribazoletransferase [Xanthobacter sp. DSM 24535]|uniref:adenosylcobinamide-GDP ribazoletransferase n=1 Tax=Roseixanthobacter psychrophilus TaxID=3119917 RepID=UPI0037286D93